MAILGGPAIPVSAQTGGRQQGGAAIPVAVVTDGRGVVGGPALPVYVVTSGPVQGGPALPIVAAATGRAVQSGPAIPVYVVSGSLGGGAPANTGLPIISGTTELGQTLTTTNGTWTNTPTSYSYQWYRDGVAIGGATSSTYVLVSADMDATITVVVTATNASGSGTATSAGTPVNWLLLDRFTTNAAAPLASPRTCEPGPGTLTLTDTGNKLSIVGSKLVSAAPTVGFSDPRVSGTTIARVQGRALMVRGAKGTSWRIGFADSADTSPRGGPLLNSSAFFHYDNASPVGGLVAASGATSYDMLIVQQDYNTFSAVLGGAWAAWTMLFSGGIRNAANITVNAAATQKIYFDVNAAWEVDSLEEWDLLGVYSLSYGWATVHETEPAPAGVTGTVSSADMLAIVEWTPAAAATMELSIRRTDNDNRWIVRCDQTGSTVKLIERNAGVETERASAAMAWGTGSKQRVWVRAETQRISFGTEVSLKGTYTTASFNQAVAGVAVSASNATSLGYWRAYPLALPTTPVAGTAAGIAPIQVFPYGDSVTVGTGDSAAPNGVSGGYPRWLCDGIEPLRGAGCYERPGRLAVGGRTTALAKAAVDAELAALAANTPDYILYNLGANDVTAMPVQATWQTNALYIWDAMHVKWPNAIIYVMRIWVRGQLANVTTYDDTWLPTAVALRSSFVFLHAALDERVILEAGDDGVTYTVDGVHPNRAGYIRMGAAWQTALGY